MIPTMPADVVLAVSHSIELSIATKATAMLILGLIAVRLAARAPASVRHLLLTTMFGSLLVLPLIVIATPGVTIDVPVAAADAHSTLSPGGNSPAVLAPVSPVVGGETPPSRGDWSAAGSTIVRWDGSPEPHSSRCRWR
jgi:hypothetical protein